MISDDVLDLVDWRRRVFEIYRAVRLADDPAEAWHRWRRERDELFKHHPQSPVPVYERRDFDGLAYFDYNPAARVIASVVPLREPEPSTVEASEGTMEVLRFATAAFTLFDQPQELSLFWFSSYGGGMFLSFKDATSGKESYGGARYLLDTVKGADLGAGDAEIPLDFNFAYQPSCSYDPRWVCPLAPMNNRLKVEVRAGERWNKP